ncbi:transcriptional regulator family: Fungal Specific TF [Aspergillus niger]|uniref:Contig An12c0200, genomic contig n=3 Tax=Aspergillus niger TaxID=5061 RepID=A2R003_ASPNC|nr:uncharacterized protein An12g06860 [Aspergillus niger]RDH14298.1 hypothetical protein M747DRAFT_347227 [Aspergillus niger ATCC 13496]KAI2812773.1 transcriptional regulator family: Fungal Specific TF [Aspergillus niger]KAI2836871.1 transcriptional regulator family: Fungal Specific TF [Aspergillus niger]KAI2869476.1 transcriptional regulator family: Fungal Specific TF [Aspergillus niger]KAI2953991.1 transcriptional regulator family: Fungal Specific TF [Aspergillus niger]
MASTDKLVMNSLLTLSACLWATVEQKKEIGHIVFYFRCCAMKELQIAVSKFSKDNCDTILAATMLLLWASDERSSWIIFWDGLQSALKSMPQVWKQESELANFIESQQYFQILKLPSCSSYQIPDKDLPNLSYTIVILQYIRDQIWHIDKYFDPVNKLVDFLEKCHDEVHFLSPDQAFQRVHSMRKWLFWLPPTVLREGTGDTLGLAILAQFFTAGLVLNDLYPEAGCHDLGQLAVRPIEEIYCTVYTRSTRTPQDQDVQLAMSLVEWPRYIANQYSSQVIDSVKVPISYSLFPWQTHYINYSGMKQVSMTCISEPPQAHYPEQSEV